MQVRTKHLAALDYADVSRLTRTVPWQLSGQAARHPQPTPPSHSKRTGLMLAPQVNLRTEIVYIQNQSMEPDGFHGPVGSATPGSDLGVNLGETDFSQEQWWGLWTCCQKRQSHGHLSNIQVQEGGNDPEHGDEPHP
jgi:hypothetical protein